MLLRLDLWDRFEMKTMKGYQSLYLKFNVLFLADVFGKFRNDLKIMHYTRAIN